MAFNPKADGVGLGSVISKDQPSGITNSYTVGTYNAVADGFDLVYFQGALQAQMGTIQNSIDAIQNNANLSDTEKMFSMQMAMNTWSAVANLRTNMLKSVSDTLKTITRNVN